ncbi:tetratricopeptide repeat protein [Stieleria sp. TO1_6]|uniref:tetratricopeptide repeat protein n=1 Tax=Stieleria tagensis TaxID=2956795 RepID=UPI00209A72D0|nr:tetratricopeptide repeat protein [Stieleria tagensis]MCO8123686.1 tetratricopeptide repeat protein [Stieleria tagensis]
MKIDKPNSRSSLQSAPMVVAHVKPTAIRASAWPTHALIGVCFLISATGCKSFRDSGGDSSWRPKMPFGALAGTEPATPKPEAPEATSGGVANADGTLAEKSPSTNRLVGFVTGKNDDLPKAKQLYISGDTLFKRATAAAKTDRVELFEQAADQFKAAAKAAPGSALEQDALFMQGEAMFFANDLNGARDALEKLQKDYPRNRHSDRAAARLFAISKYWIDVSKAGSDSWYTLNFFDSTRPLRDADGHAIKVLDQIRYDDPTGKLADDATMAAAAEHIRGERYDQADEFLTDLRETFTDSDHLFLAHLLGIRCKLQIYAGPRYSERVLDEAETLVKQTRRRFPLELKEEKYNDMLARASAEIAYHQAEKLAFRARYREKQREYAAAGNLYQKLLRDHPTTPQAKEAREVLARIEKLPGSPTKQLAFLAKVFPSAKKSIPLETVESARPADDATPEDTPSESTGKVMMR